VKAALLVGFIVFVGGIIASVLPVLWDSFRDWWKTFRLSGLTGWQRIGVVLTLLWWAFEVFVGYATTPTDPSTYTTVVTIDDAVALKPLVEQYQQDLYSHWVWCAVFTLIATVIAWLLAYAMKTAWRWVRRGFALKKAGAQ
jgi:hypothetical protein